MNPALMAATGGLSAPVGFVLGAASGLFSKSPAEERQARYEQYKKERAGVRSTIASGFDDSLKKGSEQIGRQTAGLTSRFKNAAASRASAMGRTNDTEAFQVPVVGQVANAGSNAMSDLGYNIGEQKNRALMNFDNQTLSADADYADRPIEPNASDFVQELSPLVTQYAQNQQLNNGLTPKTNPNGTPSITPTDTGITQSRPAVQVNSLPAVGRVPAPQMDFSQNNAPPYYLQAPVAPAQEFVNPIYGKMNTRVPRKQIFGRNPVFSQR
jgi:hypothetical protein